MSSPERALLPPIVAVWALFLSLFFLQIRLQLTLPADESEHPLPAPALIIRIPREMRGLPLLRAPHPSKAESSGRGQWDLHG